MHDQSHGNLPARVEENSSALDSSQLPNQKLTRKLQEANNTLRESQLETKELITEHAELNKNISTAGPKVDTKVIVKANPTIGTFKTSEIRPIQEIRSKTSKTVSFENKYTMVPGVVVGLTLVDICQKMAARVSGYASAIRLSSFEINLDSWNDTRLFEAACDWLEIEADDLDFQYGSYHTIEHYHWSATPAENTQRITFKRAYQSPPRVVVWLNLFDIATQFVKRIKTFATDVTATGFNLHIDSWSDTKLGWAMASWLAYPTDRPGLASGSFSTRDIRSPGQPQLYNSSFEPFPSGVFEKPPKVFLALNSLEIDNKHNQRLKVTADNVSATGMTWHLDSWCDTILYSAGASYIAFR
ncbi:hypothetical protein Q9L58_001877 [Maublancomyces gigas]|uniref:H-type lectin domain-containing protein n=1 Tax=Discina gigas TaxID=1032678 RepID=A0ABR3GTS3_9PEZI